MQSAAFIDLNVLLGHSTGTAATITYETEEGTADAGVDYDNSYEQGTATGQIVIPVGEHDTTISVHLNHGYDEPDIEDFTLHATHQDYSASATGLIYDSDDPPTLSISDASADEDAGVMTFIVSLSETSGKTITVNYETFDGAAGSHPAAGGAGGDGDYSSISGQLTFAPGDTQKTIAVTIVDDTEFEYDETYSVSLSGATNATISDEVGIGTIENDDLLPIDVYVADANLNPLELLSVTGGVTESLLWGDATYVQLETVTVEVTLPSTMQSSDFFLVLQADTGLSVWTDAARTTAASVYPEGIIITSPYYCELFYVDPGDQVGQFNLTAKVYQTDPFTQQAEVVGEGTQSTLWDRISYDGMQFVIERGSGWAESGAENGVKGALDGTFKPVIESAISDYVATLDPGDPDYSEKVANVNATMTQGYEPARDLIAEAFGTIAFEITEGYLAQVLPEKPPGSGPGVTRPISDAMAKIFEDVGSLLDQESLHINVDFKGFGDILGAFGDALDSAVNGQYSDSLECLTTAPRFIDSIGLTVDLTTADDKIIPLTFGCQFDYVPGQGEWHELEQLQYNLFFIEFGLRGQDWGFVDFDKDLRFGFRPKSRTSGLFEFLLEGGITW